MQQLEVAQLEIDCYRKEAMLSMLSQADDYHQRHIHQHQHAISSSLSSTESWNSTADFVKAKLSSLNVREFKFQIDVLRYLHSCSVLKCIRSGRVWNDAVLQSSGHVDSFKLFQVI
jgi:hypothetical protein